MNVCTSRCWDISLGEYKRWPTVALYEMWRNTIVRRILCVPSVFNWILPAYNLLWHVLCTGGGRGGIHLSVFPPHANVSFTNQTNGSALCSDRTFLLALSERHVIRCDQRGVSAIKIYNAFWMWVSSHQANINLKCHSMLGRMIVNVVIHRKGKQHYLHNTVCGADHPVRIMCALNEQNLNRPLLISGFLSFQFSIPQVPHSMFSCLVSPTSSSSHVSSVGEKINKPPNQVTCSRQTDGKLLTAEFEMWILFLWQYTWSCFGQEEEICGTFCRKITTRNSLNELTREPIFLEMSSFFCCHYTLQSN